MSSGGAGGPSPTAVLSFRNCDLCNEGYLPLVQTIAPGQIIGGSTQTALATVTLNAPSRGQYVSMSRSDVGLSIGGGTGYIANGQTFTTLTLSYPEIVTSAKQVTITATLGLSSSADLSVVPFQPTLTISPGAIVGGSIQTATATISLNATSAQGGYVGISSSPSALSIAGSGYIASGKSSTTLTFSYSSVISQPTTFTITASFGGSTTGSLMVTCPKTTAMIWWATASHL